MGQELTVADKKIATLGDYLEGRLERIKESAASHVDLYRLYKLLIGTVSKTPELLNCSQESILRCLQQSAEVGLEIGTATGEAYAVPRKGEATFIIGYRGYLTLARRSGLIKGIHAYPVFNGEPFKCMLGSEPRIDHEFIPTVDRSWPQMVCVYAVALTSTEEVLLDCMSKAECEAIRRRPGVAQNGPWSTDPVEMARKTAIRRLSKVLPLSIEMARAVAIEEEQECGPIVHEERPVFKKLSSPPLTMVDGATVDTETGEITETSSWDGKGQCPKCHAPATAKVHGVRCEYAHIPLEGAAVPTSARPATETTAKGTAFKVITEEASQAMPLIKARDEFDARATECGVTLDKGYRTQLCQDLYGDDTITSANGEGFLRHAIAQDKRFWMKGIAEGKARREQIAAEEAEAARRLKEDEQAQVHTAEESAEDHGYDHADVAPSAVDNDMPEDDSDPFSDNEEE